MRAAVARAAARVVGMEVEETEAARAVGMEVEETEAWAEGWEVVATARGFLGLEAVAAKAVMMEVAVMVKGREAEARAVARAVV